MTRCRICGFTLAMHWPVGLLGADHRYQRDDLPPASTPQSAVKKPVSGRSLSEEGGAT